MELEAILGNGVSGKQSSAVTSGFGGAQHCVSIAAYTSCSQSQVWYDVGGVRTRTTGNISGCFHRRHTRTARRRIADALHALTWGVVAMPRAHRKEQRLPIHPLRNVYRERADGRR